MVFITTGNTVSETFYLQFLQSLGWITVILLLATRLQTFYPLCHFVWASFQITAICLFINFFSYDDVLLNFCLFLLICPAKISIYSHPVYPFFYKTWALTFTLNHWKLSILWHNWGSSLLVQNLHAGPKGKQDFFLLRGYEEQRSRKNHMKKLIIFRQTT